MRSMGKRLAMCALTVATSVAMTVGVIAPTAARADDGDAVFGDGVFATAAASYSCSARTVEVFPMTNELLAPGNFSVWAKAYVFNNGAWIVSDWFHADGITEMVFSGITAPYRYAYITYARYENGAWREPSDWVYTKDDLDNSATFCNGNPFLTANAAAYPTGHQIRVSVSSRPRVAAAPSLKVRPPSVLQTGVRSATSLEPTPSDEGYWVTNRAGTVSTFGDAHTLGSWGALAPGESITGLSSMSRFDIRHPAKGYWLFSNKGRVKSFGDARFHGDMRGTVLNGPVLGSVPTKSGRGYYMVASDGGIFAFGDAHFYGSMGGRHLNAPIRALVPTASGKGYWLVARDGGIFAFGDARFRGSMGAAHLNRPIVGMVRYGNGYLMVGSDGGTFDFSNTPFRGSLGKTPPVAPIVAVATTEGATGYWMLGATGTVYGFGGANVFHHGQAQPQPRIPQQAAHP